MRLLREFIRAMIASRVFTEAWDEIYERELHDDPAFDRDTLWVEDEPKEEIQKWMRDMGLARKRKGSK